jgi:hypothetical protein
MAVKHLQNRAMFSMQSSVGGSQIFNDTLRVLEGVDFADWIAPANREDGPYNYC